MSAPSFERTEFVADIERRLFLRQSLSLGALTLLSGCDITDQDAVQKVLNAISRWNDGAQAALFSSNRLAPIYPENAVVREFRYNAYYPQDQIPHIDGASFRLELGGQIKDKRPWTLEQLYTLPQTSQITRHVCVEGLSMIGKWSGPTLRSFWSVSAPI